MPKSTHARICPLDIHKMNITGDGVQGFLWPVSYQERNAFIQKLMHEYVTILHSTPDEHALPYKFVAKYFINEAIAVFNTDAIKARIDPALIVEQCKPQWRLWHSLFQNKAPENPGFLNALKQGPNAKKSNPQNNLIKKIKRVFSLLKFKKSGIGIGHLKLKPISKHVLTHNIIATQRTEMIQKHAASIKTPVIFCRSERWFHDISDSELENAIKKTNTDIEQKIITCVETLYKEQGFALTNPSLAYLKHILKTGAALIHIHYTRLLNDPNRLPRNIWTGTGGYLWDALLRHASLNTHNADITGHDHGAGLGHVNNPFMAFNELWGCKTFICLNENQANEMSKHTENWPYLENKKANMTGWQSKTPVQKITKFSSPSFKAKTIIVLATLYGGDRVWMGPCSPDIVHVDWQARVISKLRAWGYNVILKVHPETPTPPPEALKTLGAQIRHEPLEEMIEEGDLVLFDCLYTSVFRSVLATNMPMVMIDFYDHPWTDKALNMFKKRASFIQGGFDKKERACIDWNILKQALENATSKNNNHEFFEYYYG